METTERKPEGTPLTRATLDDEQTLNIAAARQLAYQIKFNPPPTYFRGISERAHKRIRRLARKLSYADAEKFASPPTGDPSYRRALRFLAALAPEDEDNLARYVLGILGTTNLSYAQTRGILAGEGEVGERGGETPAVLLRDARVLLKDGMSQRAVAEELGIARQQVTDLSTFLGTVQARRDVLMDQALDHIEQGGTITGFAEKADISRDYARKIIRETEAALA